MSRRAVCDVPITPTADDVNRLSELPYAVNDVPDTWRCELVDGHAGPHMFGSQAQEGEGCEVYWWASWKTDGSRYALTSGPICPETFPDPEEGDVFCCLPLAHEGPHDQTGRNPAPLHAALIELELGESSGLSDSDH